MGDFSSILTNYLYNINVFIYCYPNGTFNFICKAMYKISVTISKKHFLFIFGDLSTGNLKTIKIILQLKKNYFDYEPYLHHSNLNRY